jgi:hypothetical protein
MDFHENPFGSALVGTSSDFVLVLGVFLFFSKSHLLTADHDSSFANSSTHEKILASTIFGLD